MNMHAEHYVILLRKPDFYEEYTESNNYITLESNIITVTYY